MKLPSCFEYLSSYEAIDNSQTITADFDLPYTNDPIAIDLNNDGQSEVTIVGVTTTNVSGIVKGL